MGDNTTEAKWKVIRDPVHGFIKIHPLLNKIIETPQFQRLKNKQLDVSYLYPGATHSRFEHSIGVSHIAGLLIEGIRERQPELPITDEDVLCVKIAGLCLDLGHLMDDKFNRQGTTWNHENGSVQMLKHLIEENGLREEFETRLGENGITFIKEQIDGKKDKSPNGKEDWQYDGRDEEKGFLYEIVANNRNGIDVDKWEYLARDCYMLGIKSNFDHLRCMHFVRVIQVDGEWSCQRDSNMGDNTTEAKWKVINDPVHGLIKIHPLLNKIIDTPQFQRLRNIKQLGAVSYVYPGATHSRFEHSIGVSHIAGLLIEGIRERQPELHITDEDVLCVKIAGLCHDLGHGPFSHLFDGDFIPRISSENTWKHEEGSKLMLKHLIEKNGLRKEFSDWGLKENDIKFIEEQIAGKRDKGPNVMEGWQYAGRDEEKGFLYEIVANKRNGIDVDKWEYLARDCYMLGIKSNFDHLRCMHFVRVIEVEGEYQICARDKEYGNLYDMFHTRYNLHQRACKHRVVKIIDNMLLDAMEKADDHIKFKGKDGNELKMSETIDDMEAFCKLTDHVFHQIYLSEKKELKEAKELLQNIFERKLYATVGQRQLTKEQTDKLKKPAGAQDGDGDVDVKKLVQIEVIKKLDKKPNDFHEADVVVNVISFNHGFKDKNPMDCIYFYKKDNDKVARKMEPGEHPPMLTSSYSETQILVFYKKRNDKDGLDLIKSAFEKWCDETFPKDNTTPEEVNPQE